MAFTRRPDSWLHLPGSTQVANEISSAPRVSDDSLSEFISETSAQPVAKPHASMAVPVSMYDVAPPSQTRIQFSTADFRSAIQWRAGSQPSERRRPLTAAALMRRVAIRMQRLRARGIQDIRIPAWIAPAPDMRRFAPSTRFASFGGGAVAGVVFMWFAAAQPASPVVPPIAPAVARQAALPPPDVRTSVSNAPVAAEAPSPRVTPQPSSTVTINARTVGTSGDSRIAATPSVKPGKAATVAPARYKGSLAFQSAPQGARVFVNGAFVGSTPLTLQNLPVGSRAVRMEADGYQRWSASTRVVANQQTRVSATLGLARP